jgi:uncharacterized membrane-anchored protein
MTIPQDRRWLFVTMLLTFPCPIIVLLGFGLLPVSALALPFVSFVVAGFTNPFAFLGALLVVVYVVLNGACLYWLAGFLARRLSSERFQPEARARGLVIAALVILALLPVYSFDHMDGRSLRWCNWYELHLGFYRVVEPCGDFHK